MDIGTVLRKIYDEKGYEFFWQKPLVGNICLLGLGGSHAYGTNNADSDIDLRGVALNSRKFLLTGQDFQQVVDTETDTTVYSFDKMVKLLCSCNPNTIEILGLNKEHYLVITPAGRELIDNRKMFLSRIAAYSFGGYATGQLRRLENKVGRALTQPYQEENILKSIHNAEVDYRRKYEFAENDSIKLYIDESNRKDLETEIYMDVNLHHYPLRDYLGMWNDMNNIVKEYGKIGVRNHKAIKRNSLAKHMMHLIRLYYMCFDILEKEEIITYRAEEHAFLLDIRNGMYLTEDEKIKPEFYDIVSELEKRLEYDKNNTSLPEKVDTEKVNDFLFHINEKYSK